MKMGKVPILDSINKVPGGLMVIPLILGVLANTFFPDALQIGSFTTALFKSGANCLIGLMFFCSGAQIQFKSAGMSLYKGVVINLGKVLTGVACGVILAKVAGPEAAFLGVTPLAMIGAMSNSNGGLYTALASKYGDDTDVGAVAIISSNDGPFFEMIFHTHQFFRKCKHFPANSGGCVLGFDFFIIIPNTVFPIFHGIPFLRIVPDNIIYTNVLAFSAYPAALAMHLLLR
jgi:hypothetical protein